jgi:thiazole synthase
MQDDLIIAGQSFSSRLFLGTGKFSSADMMKAAVQASGTEMVTVALKRIDIRTKSDSILLRLKDTSVNLLPNTSGVRTAKEAIFAAQAAREALETNWIKLEIHPDPRYLMPDPIETLIAATELVKQGFVVLPYVHADPVLCKRLEEAGVQAVMPLGSPIGSNKGLETREFLRIILEQSLVPVIVDAGIGAPSHAVLVNTAIAIAHDPVGMATAFRLATESGRLAYKARLASVSDLAQASSPLDVLLDQ